MSGYLNNREEDLAASHNPSELLAMVVTRLEDIQETLHSHTETSLFDLIEDAEKTLRIIALLQTDCEASRKMKNAFANIAKDTENTAKEAAEYWT